MTPGPSAAYPATPPPTFAPWREFVRANWRWHALLAAPFVACAIYLLSTGRAFLVFWGDDELHFHWPMIRRLASELPHMNWRYTETATTPLLHLLGACVVKLFGPNLQLVRLLNAAFSVGGVWALFGILHRYRRLPSAVAALFAAAFLTSCYFFGYSFRLLTDDMALVWCILAMARLYRFVDPAQNAGLSTFLWGCLWLGLTIFTRQSYLFLGLPFLVVLPGSSLSNSQKLIGLAGLALAAAPFATLVVVWHGLVPPAFHERHVPGLLNFYAIALPLMLLGLYAPFFYADAIYRFFTGARLNLHRAALPAGAAVVGLLVVALFPLDSLTGQHARAGYIPPVAWNDPPGYFAGWLYNASGHLPTLRGNSLLFFGLLPVGLAAAAVLLRSLALPGVTASTRLGSWFLLALLVSSILNSISAQKYYDGLVLLVLAWHYPQGESPKLPGKIALASLIFLFCVYQAFILARH